KDYASARRMMRQGFSVSVIIGSVLAAACVALSPFLPGFLGAEGRVASEGSLYFAICAAAFPLSFLGYTASCMIRATGNIRVPSVLNVAMCALDVFFNYLLIYPTREVEFASLSFTCPGAGLGVPGAALGTVLAETVVLAPYLWYACVKSPELRIVGERGRFLPERETMRRAFAIGVPVGGQRAAMSLAQIGITMIVAPLGPVAIAANSLAVTAESVCYMPGFGVADAATTLVGQSVGAKRPDLAMRFARLTTGAGIAVMSLMGVLLFLSAHFLLGLMTNDPGVVSLGATCLRIEAFAEPMFAAAIVIYGAFVGAGDTFIPSLMNPASLWLIRLPASWFLAQHFGLVGVWIAMAGELTLRGALFILRLRSGKWLKAHHGKAPL
ncbi:MAG: MATE family efflux transporter, partial [Sutterellaceae bacterium]|nr:MATE family efflux transporter [Sutterellaceae bacterium]